MEGILRVAIAGIRLHVMHMNAIIEKILEKFGLTAITTILLILYHQSETSRWERNQQDIMVRWEQTLKQSEERSTEQLKLVSQCCQTRIRNEP